MKLYVALSALIGCALGMPQYYQPEPAYAPAPYAPAPAPYHEEKIPPKPFEYGYGGVDYNGQAFSKNEAQDEYGVVNGEYRVQLPDGRTQIVRYRADHESGFVADVQYEGEARPYEPEPYVAKKPAYAPRPEYPPPYARN